MKSSLLFWQLWRTTFFTLAFSIADLVVHVTSKYCRYPVFMGHAVSCKWMAKKNLETWNISTILAASQLYSGSYVYGSGYLVSCLMNFTADVLK